MTNPPPGYRLLMSPDLITNDELTRRLSVHPQTVWREGDLWRICVWSTGHEAFHLLEDGWQPFDDWEERDDD